jgi:hypothetical protein
VAGEMPFEPRKLGPHGLARGRKLEPKRLGPRGGTTTVAKSGMVRMTLWLDADEAEALRERAFAQRRTKSELVREGLRRLFNIED